MTKGSDCGSAPKCLLLVAAASKKSASESLVGSIVMQMTEELPGISLVAAEKQRTSERQTITAPKFPRAVLRPYYRAHDVLLSKLIRPIRTVESMVVSPSSEALQEMLGIWERILNERITNILIHVRKPVILDAPPNPEADVSIYLTYFPLTPISSCKGAWKRSVQDSVRRHVLIWFKILLSSSQMSPKLPWSKGTTIKDIDKSWL